MFWLLLLLLSLLLIIILNWALSYSLKVPTTSGRYFSKNFSLNVGWSAVATWKSSFFIILSKRFFIELTKIFDKITTCTFLALLTIRESNYLLFSIITVLWHHNKCLSRLESHLIQPQQAPLPLYNFLNRLFRLVSIQKFESIAVRNLN